MHWPNMRVRFKNGAISFGGMTAADFLPGRNQRQVVLPQFGRVYDSVDPNPPSYITAKESADIRASGWERTLGAANYIEVIVHLDDDDDDYDSRLREGRRKLATLATVLDLALGPRGLAMPLAEEVGETFDDWHWNRRLNTGTILVESQAELRPLPPDRLQELLEPTLQRSQSYAIDEQRRIRLACQWYWRADADTDPVTKFISWWLVIESIAMPSTTNIAPVRERLAAIFGDNEVDWRAFMGKLYGLRSRLVHGNDSEAPASSLSSVELVARTLLFHWLMDEVPTEVRANLLEARGS
jgi:hypothetical protein